jgi:tRNA pseudouridine38-40 synthase
MLMNNIKMTIAYDGTKYHGYQEQKGTKLVTIQRVVEDCLKKLAGKEIKITGAARTDAGVHARGQVVNFDATGWPIPVERIPLALNSILPDDIVSLGAQKVSPDFHARYGAKAKTYCYTIYNARVPSPFWRLYSHFEPRFLNIEAMSTAAKYLEGTHDFASFQASGSSSKTTVRTLFRVEICRKKEVVRLSFLGNGFLYNMVRILTGTLLEVGLGKLSPEEIRVILDARERARAGPTAPAHGLCLINVEY